MTSFRELLISSLTSCNLCYFHFHMFLYLDSSSWVLGSDYRTHTGAAPPRPPPLAPQNHHCAFAFNIKSTLYRAHYIHHYDFSMPCRCKSNISILCNCCCSTMFTLSRFLDPSQTWVHLSNIGEKHPKWYSDGNKIAYFILVSTPQEFLVLKN